MGYAEDINRCMKIFRSNQLSSGSGPLTLHQKTILNDRMLETFHLLNSYNSSRPNFEENIHWVAILGAIGRLFEALMSTKVSSKILSWDFKVSARRVIYHSRGPFAVTNLGMENKNFLINPDNTIAFFMHCYEHCRGELAHVGIVSASLAHKIKLSDREQPWFHIVMNAGSIWAEQRIKDSEIKARALARLISNKAKFIANVEFLRKNERCFVELSNPDGAIIANMIRGNYIGAELAWLSCDVSSLRNCRAVDEQLKTGSTNLSAQEREMLNKKYGKYVELGKSYRHGNLNITDLLERYGLNTYIQLEPRKILTPVLFSPRYKKQNHNRKNADEAFSESKNPYGTTVLKMT